MLCAQIPNYYRMIVNPMDLGTVRSRLSRAHFNHYQTVEEFVSDIQLIFTNCDTFNPVCYSRRVSYCRMLVLRQDILCQGAVCLSSRITQVLLHLELPNLG